MERKAFALAQLFSLQPLSQALFATLLTYLLTALGASLVLLTRRAHPAQLDLMMSLGAGVMLASSYFSLLAPCVERAEELGQPGYAVACAGFLLGGGLLLVSDHFLPLREPDARRSLLLFSSITLHNIPEGLAVGVTFGALSGKVTPEGLAAAWMLAIGIAIQNFPEGAAVSLPLRREGMSRGRAFWWGQLSGLVEPIAGILGAAVAVFAADILPFLLAFAAGAMVTVVVSELVPEGQKSPHPRLMTLFLLLGFAVMMGLDVALG